MGQAQMPAPGILLLLTPERVQPAFASSQNEEENFVGAAWRISRGGHAVQAREVM